MLKKLIQFFRWLFRVKPKEKPESFQDKIDKAAEEVLEHPEKSLVNVKKKINTFAFRKQQLEGKVFFTENKLYRIEKFLGFIMGKTTRFKYEVKKIK